MVRAKLLYVQFSLVETQPELFIDSRLGWRSGERGEEELISSPNTSGTLHVTAHAVGAAVHLVSTAGCIGVGTTTDTCRGEVRGEREGCGDSPSPGGRGQQVVASGQEYSSSCLHLCKTNMESDQCSPQSESSPPCCWWCSRTATGGSQQAGLTESSLFWSHSQD